MREPTLVTNGFRRRVIVAETTPRGLVWVSWRIGSGAIRVRKVKQSDLDHPAHQHHAIASFAPPAIADAMAAVKKEQRRKVEQLRFRALAKPIEAEYRPRLHTARLAYETDFRTRYEAAGRQPAPGERVRLATKGPLKDALDALREEFNTKLRAAREAARDAAGR